VGTTVSKNGTMHVEISTRNKAMRASGASLHYQFFMHPDVCTKTKTTILKSVMLSSGMYNASTWPLLSSAEFFRVAKAIISEYCGAVPEGREEIRRSRFTLLYTRHGLLAPINLLVFHRLGLFIRVAHKAPPWLIILLTTGQKEPRSWLTAIAHDIQYVCSHDNAFPELKGKDLAVAFSLARSAPTAMRRKLTRHLMSEEFNGPEAWLPDRSEAPAAQTVTCPLCQQAFPSAQKLALHSFSVHHQINNARRLATGPTCIFCLQDFHSRLRTIKHLHNSPRCRYLYTHVCPPIPAAVLSALEETDSINARALAANGLSRFAADLPAVRLEGPLLEEADILGISHQYLLSTGRKGIGLEERAPRLHAFIALRPPILPAIPPI
jgi:hypothetical protein